MRTLSSLPLSLQDEADPGAADLQLRHEGGGGQLPGRERVGA